MDTPAPTTAIPTADGPAEASPCLAALLDQAAGLGPEYGPGLSSHLPMALAALAALGADDARLQQYFDHASTAFGAPRPPVTPHSLGAAWTSLRGRIDAFDALAAHFAASLAQEGIDRVLRRSLPDLLDGVCAAAFHGLIRVAYAAQAGRPAELATALAYWACRWLPLPRPGAGVELEPDAWCERLLAAPTLPRPAGASITARVEAIVGNASYATLAGRLRAAAGDDHAGAAEQLARLARLAVERYLCSRNFTVLHMVTGAHALRALWRWLDDPSQAVARFADACAAAYLASGITPGGAPLPSPGFDWPDIVARACRSDDAHEIKFVHSCRAEAAVYGDEAYRDAAALAVA